MALTFIDYLRSIATYFFDAFAIFYNIGMTPFGEFLIGNYHIDYTNPFSGFQISYLYEITDMPFLGAMFGGFKDILSNLLESMPFFDYFYNTPTIFVLLTVAGLISVVYYIWQVIVG